MNYKVNHPSLQGYLSIPIECLIKFAIRKGMS